MVNLLGRALEDANQVIISRIADSQDAEVDRGVALAVAVIFDHRLYVSNIGDCRIYLQRAGEPLTQITVDHTVPDPLSEEPELTHLPDAGPGRYLGMNSEVQPDFRMRLDSDQSDEVMVDNQGTALQPGDRLVIMTRAVTRALSNQHIERIINRHRPQLAALQLTRTTVSQPSVRSASALVVQVPRSGVQTWKAPLQVVRRYGVWILLILVFIAGTVFGAENLRSPLATATPPHFAPPSETPTAEAATTEQETATTTPTATMTRQHVPVYTRPPLPSETPIPPSPTATESPTFTPTPSTVPTATSRPTQIWLTYTPSPVFTPSDTPAPPPSNTQRPQPTNTPVPQPTNTEPPPPTDTPPPPPSATPRPTLTAPRPTLTPE